MFTKKTQFSPYLPPEIWSLIISYLDYFEKLKIRTISKPFKIIADKTLWLDPKNSVKTNNLYNIEKLIEKGLFRDLKVVGEKNINLKEYNRLIKHINVVTEKYNLNEQKIFELVENGIKKRVPSFYDSHVSQFLCKTIIHTSLAFVLSVALMIYLMSLELSDKEMKKCYQLQQFENNQDNPFSNCQKLFKDDLKLFLVEVLLAGMCISYFIKLLSDAFLTKIDYEINELSLKKLKDTEAKCNFPSKIVKSLKYRDHIALLLAAALAITFVSMNPFEFDINKCLETNQNTTSIPFVYEYQLDNDCLNSMMENLKEKIFPFSFLEGFFIILGLSSIMQIIRSIYHRATDKPKSFNTSSNFFKGKTGTKDEQTLLLENNEHRISYS